VYGAVCFPVFRYYLLAATVFAIVRSRSGWAAGRPAVAQRGCAEQRGGRAVRSKWLTDVEADTFLAARRGTGKAA
jgi:hypothetical protein